MALVLQLNKNLTSSEITFWEFSILRISLDVPLFQQNNSSIPKLSHCVKSVQIRSFFWSVFSCIWTEYGDLRSNSPYSVWIWENTDQTKLRIWTLFMQWVLLFIFFIITRRGIVYKWHNFFCLCSVSNLTHPQSFRKGTKSSGNFDKISFTLKLWSKYS